MNEEIEQFTLKKVKYIPDSNLLSSFIMQEIRGDETYNNKGKLESNKLPHPDLTSLLTQIIPMAKRVLMYGEDQSVQVTGLSITGFEETKAVVITTLVMAPAGVLMGIPTHKIELSGDVYAFEEELSGITDKIEKEVFEYLFKGKKAQLELFDPLEA
jgi:hypothetical protein